MRPEELKEKLHQYIDKASEEELEEILYLLGEECVDYSIAGKKRKWWEDEEFVRDLEGRVEDFESGKDKGIPWEEVHAKALESIKKS